VGNTQGLMKIGEVARKTGVSLRTIRYYEELGLINPAMRSPGGFRLYDGTALSRINLIQSLQELEMSLKEIKVLMALKRKSKTRGEVAKKLLVRLQKQSAEAERRRAVYQTILRDFHEGMRILSQCQECTRKPDQPHCGKHKEFLSEDLLPTVVRSLF